MDLGIYGVRGRGVELTDLIGAGEQELGESPVNMHIKKSYLT